MNCPETRAHLADFLAGRLEAEAHGAVEQHLALCPACQREREAPVQVHQLLDAVPAPVAAVDLSRIYRDAAARQERQARRWRRVAGLVAAAALVLVAVGLSPRLEVRMEPHQLVLRWGTPPVSVSAPPSPEPPARPAPLAPEDVQRLVAVEDQLRLMSQLVHVLAGSTDSADVRDRQRQREIAQLRDQLDDLRRQTAQRWQAAREYAEILFTAQLTSPRKGATP